MDRHELAWAAGFFDGEGWANAIVRKGRRTRQPMTQINQSDDDGVPVVLERFQRAVGVGRIGGPGCKPDRMDRYWWIASSRSDVKHVSRLLDPWLGDVKRREFDMAIGRVPQVSSITTTATQWLAWAAGLYDGEGSSCLLKHRTHAGYQTPELCITQSSARGQPEVLRRFRAIVGAGHIDGPIQQCEPWLPVYRWKSAALADVRLVLDFLWSWLGPVKRKQAQRMFDVLDAQPVLPRGNPAFGVAGSRYCLRGHDKWDARIRPFKGRGKYQVDPNRHLRQCLVCVRLDAQARRKLRRNSGRRSSRRSRVA